MGWRRICPWGAGRTMLHKFALTGAGVVGSLALGRKEKDIHKKERESKAEIKPVELVQTELHNKMS